MRSRARYKTLLVAYIFLLLYLLQTTYVVSPANNVIFHIFNIYVSFPGNKIVKASAYMQDFSNPRFKENP